MTQPTPEETQTVLRAADAYRSGQPLAGETILAGLGERSLSAAMSVVIDALDLLDLADEESDVDAIPDSVPDDAGFEFARGYRQGYAIGFRNGRGRGGW